MVRIIIEQLMNSSKVEVTIEILKVNKIQTQKKTIRVVVDFLPQVQRKTLWTVHSEISPILSPGMEFSLFTVPASSFPLIWQPWLLPDHASLDSLRTHLETVSQTRISQRTRQ